MVVIVGKGLRGACGVFFESGWGQELSFDMQLACLCPEMLGCCLVFRVPYVHPVMCVLH